MHQHEISASAIERRCFYYNEVRFYMYRTRWVLRAATVRCLSPVSPAQHLGSSAFLGCRGYVPIIMLSRRSICVEMRRARHWKTDVCAAAGSKCINMRRDRLTAASTWASKITLHNYCILHLDAQCSDRWCDLEVVTAAYKNIQILNEFSAASPKPGQLKRNSILTYPTK